MPQFYQPPAIMLNKRVMEQAGVTAADIDTSKPDALLAAAGKMYEASGGNPRRSASTRSRPARPGCGSSASAAS